MGSSNGGETVNRWERCRKLVQISGQVELRAELDVMTQATVTIQFYKSHPSHYKKCLSPGYKNMITAALEQIESQGKKPIIKLDFFCFKFILKVDYTFMSNCMPSLAAQL